MQNETGVYVRVESDLIVGGVEYNEPTCQPSQMSPREQPSHGQRKLIPLFPMTEHLFHTRPSIHKYSMSPSQRLWSLVLFTIDFYYLGILKSIH